MVWMVKEADQACRCLYRKTSGFLNSIFGSSKDSGFIESRSSGKRRDSAVQDLDFDLHHDNHDRHVASSSSRYSLSRSSSQASVCSCMACSHSGEWKRRPSRLLEGYDVEDSYRFDAVLGEGSFSTVYLGESRVTKGGWVAIKVVQKHNLLNTKKIPNPLDGEDCGQLQDDQDDQEDLISNSMREQNEREIMRLVDKEIRIMSALDHPHVIHLEEVYEDENRVCFVMELAQGGEVFDRLVEKVAFDELQTAKLVQQLLNALSYVHSCGIVHRDLKLENLLYYDDTDESKIMVADFGLSDWISDLEDGSSPICGTPGYMAPEVISRQSCTPKADVWAIGVITYILLAGYPPFFIEESLSGSENESILLKKIINGEYEFLEETWKDISPEAVEFIKLLMTADPQKRPTCDEALGHKWLNDWDNLETRAENKKRTLSESFLESHWSVGQQVAFALSVIVILGSYSALVAYVFNLGKPSVFFNHLKEEFDRLYFNVYSYVDYFWDCPYNLYLKGWNYLCSFCSFVI